MARAYKTYETPDGIFQRRSERHFTHAVMALVPNGEITVASWCGNEKLAEARCNYFVRTDPGALYGIVAVEEAIRSRLYRSKGGTIQHRPVLTERAFQKASRDARGFCLGCGKTQSGVEPDARRCACEHCRAEKVYGFAELLMMGVVIIR